LSVETAASVGFGIHLIRVHDGRLLWSRQFDETQKSLSEDLFRLGTFVKRGGAWLTAQELSRFGLEAVMEDFPSP
jgi:TolB-like protein